MKNKIFQAAIFNDASMTELNTMARDKVAKLKM